MMSNHRKSKRAYAPVTAALFLAAAPAQHPAAQQLTGFPQAELPRYTVELIVFAYADGATTGNEIFVPESPAFDERLPSAAQPGGEVPVFSDGREPDVPVFGDPGAPQPPSAEPLPADPALPGDRPAAGHGTGTGTGEDANEITGIAHNLNDLRLRTRIELQQLLPEQYSLDEVYRKLTELDAYRPIMHTAWTQTTPGQDQAPAIRLRALGEAPPGLRGTVKLYQGRFVHLGLDLELDAEGIHAGGGGRDARSATDRAIAGSVPDAGNGYSPPGSESYPPIPVYSDRGYGDATRAGVEAGYFPPPVRYRIEEVRIMRDGDLRYYDHPRFGVIAKLTKVPEQAPTRRD